MIAVALTLLLAAPPLSGTVIGRAEYEDKPFTYASGFTGAYPQVPVRFANVDLETPGGTVLASGFTDESGDFSIFLPDAGPQTFLVRVKAISSNAAAGNPRLSTVRVRDYSTSALFTVVSPTFNDVDGDFDVGTIVAPRVTESHGKEGNPFNMFDLIVDAVMYMTDPAVAGLPKPGTTLTVRWPEPSDASFASGTTATMGYRAGYDDTIILHEVGHVIHGQYSQSSNPGGTHFVGDSDQDPRLSYGEGYASFFSGAVRRWNGTFDPGVYVHSTGNPGPGGFSFGWRYENSNPYGAVGGADELAVCDLLWDLIDDVDTQDFTIGTDDDPVDGSLVFTGGLTGEQMWQEMFTGPLDGTGTRTMISVWRRHFDPLEYGHRDELVQIYDSFGMDYVNDALEFDAGFLEADLAWPLPTDSWRPLSTLYYAADPPYAPGVGDEDWVAFNADAGASITLRTRYPNGLGDAGTMCDTHLSLTDAYGTILASADDGAVGRNARIDFVAPADGTYFVRCDTVHSFRKYGGYQLKVEVSARGELWWNGNNARLTQLSLNLETDPLAPYEIYYSLRTDSVSTPNGLLLLKNPKRLLSGNAGASGRVSVVRTIPNKPALAGRTVYLQALHGNSPSYSNRIEIQVQ